MKYSVTFTPTDQQVNEIEKWLIEERDSSNEGFYCNWTIIKSFFKRGELAVLIVENNPIGFCCWRKTSELSGQINIFEIKPDFRGKGLGTLFAKELEKLFVSKNVCVIDLQCVPAESEEFWKKHSFIDVPFNIRYWDNQTKHLFKKLLPSLPEVSTHNGSNYIEIWDTEPIYTKHKESTWKWDINSDTGKLPLPIIQPCEKDWRIKLVTNNKIIIDDKIKRFGNLEIDFGPYAIITQLPVT